MYNYRNVWNFYLSKISRTKKNGLPQIKSIILTELQILLYWLYVNEKKKLSTVRYYVGCFVGVIFEMRSFLPNKEQQISFRNTITGIEVWP